MKIKSNEELSIKLKEINSGLDTDISFLQKDTIDDFKKLFNKKQGIRYYNIQVASFLINYNDKTLNLMGIFDDLDDTVDDIKVSQLILITVKIAESFGFNFIVTCFDFCFNDDLTPTDKLIQTTKMQVVYTHLMKKKKLPTTERINKIINTKNIIDKTKKLVDKYLNHSGNKIERIKGII